MGKSYLSSAGYDALSQRLWRDRRLAPVEGGARVGSAPESAGLRFHQADVKVLVAEGVQYDPAA